MTGLSSSGLNAAPVLMASPLPLKTQWAKKRMGVTAAISGPPINLFFYKFTCLVELNFGYPHTPVLSNIFHCLSTSWVKKHLSLIWTCLLLVSFNSPYLLYQRRKWKPFPHSPPSHHSWLHSPSVVPLCTFSFAGKRVPETFINVKFYPPFYCPFPLQLSAFGFHFTTPINLNFQRWRISISWSPSSCTPQVKVLLSCWKAASKRVALDLIYDVPKKSLIYNSPEQKFLKIAEAGSPCLLAEPRTLKTRGPTPGSWCLWETCRALIDISGCMFCSAVVPW